MNFLLYPWTTGFNYIQKQFKSDNQINYTFKNLKEAPSIVERASPYIHKLGGC